jgi:hypothetical protein
MGAVSQVNGKNFSRKDAKLAKRGKSFGLKPGCKDFPLRTWRNL